MQSSYLTEDELRMAYQDKLYIDTIIRKFVSYCPELNVVKTRNSKQQKLVRKALNDNKWSSLSEQVYDSLESETDCFMQIYFDNNEDKIPKLKKLRGEDLIDIQLDDKYRPVRYIHKETVFKERLDYSTGRFTRISERDIITIFEKGQTIIIDPLADNKVKYKNEFDEEVYVTKIIANRDSFKDDFSLLRIPSFKMQDEKFSRLYAMKYVPDCLTINQIFSDIRSTNKSIGFPVKHLIDGTIVGGKLAPGAYLICKSDADKTIVDDNGVENTLSAGNKQMRIESVQINNDLKSMFEELKEVRDCLYEKVGLILLTLEQKLGSTDSSRVIQQLRANLENRINLYIDNIIEAFTLYFKILFIENNEYSIKDEGISFHKPDFIVKNSPHDEIIYQSQELNNGRKSAKEIAIEQGDSIEEIEQREKDLNNNLDKLEEVKTNNEAKTSVNNANSVSLNKE